MDWADTIRGFGGLIFGGGIAIIALIGSFKLALAGYQIAASVIASLDIASIAGVFVLGTIRRSRKSSQD
jgi:hypothetical protein